MPSAHATQQDLSVDTPAVHYRLGTEADSAALSAAMEPYMELFHPPAAELRPRLAAREVVLGVERGTGRVAASLWVAAQPECMTANRLPAAWPGVNNDPNGVPLSPVLRAAPSPAAPPPMPADDAPRSRVDLSRALVLLAGSLFVHPDFRARGAVAALSAAAERLVVRPALERLRAQWPAREEATLLLENVAADTKALRVCWRLWQGVMHDFGGSDLRYRVFPFLDIVPSRGGVITFDLPRETSQELS